VPFFLAKPSRFEDAKPPSRVRLRSNYLARELVDREARMLSGTVRPVFRLSYALTISRSCSQACCS
jgi:hypothetical protein